MFQGMALIQKPQFRFALAHELRQSLHLLQMSTFDLLAHIREQEQDNPLLEVSWPEERVSRRAAGRRSSGGGLGEGAQDPFYRFQSIVTLEQRLSSQIRLLDSSPEGKRNAAFLAGNLDDSGYLAIGLEEAAACMAVSVPQMELGLRLLQA